jgi:hypothetical protein
MGISGSVRRVMSAEGHAYTTVWSDETCIRMADTNMVSVARANSMGSNRTVVGG